MTQKPPSLFDWKIAGPAIARCFPEAQPPADDQESGHVRDHGRRGADHRRAFSPRDGSRLHRATGSSGCGLPCCSPTLPRRWPKAGARPRPRPCAGRASRPNARRDRRNGRSRKSAPPTPQRRRRAWCGRRNHSRRRRCDRRRGHGGRIGHYGRIGAGHPRERRRPQRRHGRHAGAVATKSRSASPINPGEGFLDRMIALVEGAQRQKTPNEIALTILLAALTVIFLLVCVTLKPFGIYSAAEFSVPVLIALLVCLIPTTIGGLLSAIGIAGMDRLLQHNVLAMSGRAVEAAGDVDVLLLDKTGTITLGNRRPRSSSRRRASPTERWPTPRNWLRWPTKRPKAAASSCWPRRNSASAGGEIAAAARAIRPLHRPNPHERRGLSGERRAARRIRKGAADAMRAYVDREGGQFPTAISQAWRTFPAPAARRWWWPKAREVLGVDSSQGHGQGRHQGTLRAAPQDGHPHRDDHRRQPAHRHRHRRRGRRGRFPGRGQARGQTRAHPRGTEPAAAWWR